MQTSLAAVVPIYKPSLTMSETWNVSATARVTGNCQRIFLCPQGLDVGFYNERFEGFDYLRLPDAHFASLNTYNRLMLSTWFYRILQSYACIILVQADAVLLSDPARAVEWGYDYVGAVWTPPIKANWASVVGLRSLGKRLRKLGIYRDLEVGNGGLSLRRPHAFIRALQYFPMLNKGRMNEDVIIAYLGKIGRLNVAPPEVARQFAYELEAVGLSEIPDTIGFHALEKHNRELYERLEAS